MLFGEKVKALAEDRGINQVELSRMSGLSRARINAIWKNKTTDPRLESVILLAEAFGVSIDELISGVEFIKEPE